MALSRPSPCFSHPDEDDDMWQQCVDSSFSKNAVKIAPVFNSSLPSINISLYPAATGDCELGPSWLLWLCVVFGVLFLVSFKIFYISKFPHLFAHDGHKEAFPFTEVGKRPHRIMCSTKKSTLSLQVMLCVNVFLCSAMTCSFSRSEVDLLILYMS